MAAPYSGSCLCGGIRFTIASEPAAVLSCFCEHCSKGAGGTNQIIAKFAQADVNISEGEHLIATYTFTDTSSGGPKAKAFCRTCGTPLWTVPASARGTSLLIRPSLLSEWHHFKPGSEIFVANRPPWVTPVDGAEQWEGVRGR
ncbi:Mss4-like protein [Chaetomium strumarium]|uniref:Mss4-like protein n=1 Tax=Chaetomium strumarium TaxID=1170767 RepID=A0AAJ0GX39_9PEZI|nr:Mss4-like protein [Chaetomium strumarium]